MSHPGDHQQEFSTPFEPLPLVKPVTHTPLEVNEIVIPPDIRKTCTKLCYLTMTYPKIKLITTRKLSLENASPTDIPQLT